MPRKTQLEENQKDARFLFSYYLNSDSIKIYISKEINI